MKKRWNRIKTFFSKPYNVLLVLFLVVLTFLVVIPLVSIVRDTFIVHSAESPSGGRHVYDLSLETSFCFGVLQVLALGPDPQLDRYQYLGLRCFDPDRRLLCLAGLQKRHALEEASHQAVHLPVYHAKLDLGSGLEELLQKYRNHRFKRYLLFADRHSGPNLVCLW